MDMDHDVEWMDNCVVNCDLCGNSLHKAVHACLTSTCINLCAPCAAHIHQVATTHLPLSEPDEYAEAMVNVMRQEIAEQN